MKIRIPEMSEPQTPSMGATLLNGGFAAEALPHLEKEVADFPDNFIAWINLGVCYRNLQRYIKAEDALFTAIRLDPKSYHALHNLGVVYEDQRQFNLAELYFRQAHTIKPEFALSQQGVAFSMTRRGKFFEAAKLWELNRHWAIDVPQIKFWNGEPLKGKRIIVWREGGFGDHFLFWRYLWKLKEQGARVTFYGPKDLKGLLGNHPFIDSWLDERDELETADYDYCISLWSIPLAIREFPLRQTQYIDSAPHSFMHKYSNVGLCLQAGEKYKTPRRVRSLSGDFSLYAKEFSESVNFVGLQLSPISGVGDWWVDILSKGGWEATARMIAGLDLVITVDTAVAHLAGAMGKPVWLMLNANSCWCWFTEDQYPGGKSPWYPSMRIFRNTNPLDWTVTIGQVAAALREKFPVRQMVNA